MHWEELYMNWKQKIVHPETVLKKIKPGMSLFLGTGASEPRTLVKHLMMSDKSNLADLELIQLANFTNTITLDTLDARKYRLKTFSSGNMIDRCIEQGFVDLIPTRITRLHRLFETGRIPVNVGFIQITSPDESGNASLGISIDLARSVMQRSSFVVGEINSKIPTTFGDTFVNVSEFDMLVYSTEDPVYFERWETNPTFDRIARRIASLIHDKSCIAFSTGPLFESLSKQLTSKKDLGVHSPLFTDALMELIKSGAVTNQYKKIFQGKSIASYAFGTPELFKWLDRNPLVEFQGIQAVFNPVNIGKNPRFVSVIPARRIDLHGRVVLRKGRDNVISGPMELIDSFLGAQISKNGRVIFGLPSRNLDQEPNIKLSIEKFHNQFGFEESIDMVITEYGVAMLNGLSIRERAMALIEIAHPDDRQALFEQAKEEKILYPDQIFMLESSRLYPLEIDETVLFKGSLSIRFRPIKSSDEEQMRRLFYRFSDESIYYRYFHSLNIMPHSEMQEYLNVNWKNTMSIVGLVGEPGLGIIISEARYLVDSSGESAEVAIIVDEKYNGLGIATYMIRLLSRIGIKRGVKVFAAEILSSNRAMMRVFRKVFPNLESVYEEGGSYSLAMPLSDAYY
jgi:acyl-CoA hydrolase